MRTGWFDLHVHSYFSTDADWAPEALAERLAFIGAGGFALTDHETVQGIERALAAAGAVHIVCIPGIEFTAALNGRHHHILAYGVPYTSAPFRSLVDRALAARWEKTLRRVEYLQSLGYVITPEEIGYGSGRTPPVGPRLAEYLFRLHPENRQRFLHTHPDVDPNLPVEVAFYRRVIQRAPVEQFPTALAARELIPALRDFGVVPVLAHPGCPYYYVTDEEVEQLVRFGIGGIEVYSTYHDDVERQRAQALADRLHLVATGGSDFHGSFKPHIQLHGRYGVTPDVVEALGVG